MNLLDFIAEIKRNGLRGSAIIGFASLRIVEYGSKCDFDSQWDYGGGEYRFEGESARALHAVLMLMGNKLVAFVSVSVVCGSSLCLVLVGIQTKTTLPADLPSSSSSVGGAHFRSSCVAVA